MHIVITDSGLGGLSVCAHLINLLKNYSVPENSDQISFNIKISYINAVPSNDKGYNKMSGMKEQIKTFEKIISNSVRLLSPDNIFVACGTLSVLLDNLALRADKSFKINGIVNIGIQLLVKKLKTNPGAKAIIMATPTTINNKTFHKELLNNGISENQIVEQSCPNLANEISNDPVGVVVGKQIKHWVKNSLKKFNGTTKDHLIIFLGCTHYGYHENIFKMAFINEGFQKITVLNPNYTAAEKLKNYVLDNQIKNLVFKNRFLIKFLSPYEIPENEIITLNKLITPISPETSKALKNPKIVPELLND